MFHKRISSLPIPLFPLQFRFLSPSHPYCPSLSHYHPYYPFSLPFQKFQFFSIPPTSLYLTNFPFSSSKNPLPFTPTHISLSPLTLSSSVTSILLQSSLSLLPLSRHYSLFCLLISILTHLQPSGFNLPLSLPSPLFPTNSPL